LTIFDKGVVTHLPLVKNGQTLSNSLSPQTSFVLSLIDDKYICIAVINAKREKKDDVEAKQNDVCGIKQIKNERLG